MDGLGLLFDIEPRGEQRMCRANGRRQFAFQTPIQRQIDKPSSVPAPPGAPMDHCPRLPKPREHLFVERCKCVVGASSSDNCRPRCVGGSPFADGSFCFCIVIYAVETTDGTRPWLIGWEFERTGFGRGVETAFYES